MTLRKLFSLALLFTTTTALINCSGKHSCYAESSECDPNNECQTVLHFDPSGNVDIYVRNVSVTDYISIVTDRDLFNTMEYFVCVPFAGQRLRALGRTGQTILFNQQNLTNIVERLDTNSFRCIINANELESDFRQNGNFIVARGKFQQFLKINEGVKLYKVEQEESNNVENDLQTEHFIPTVYNVAAPIVKADKSLYSWKEDPEVSKMLQKIEHFLFYHAENWKALDVVEDLNTQVDAKVLKKLRHQKRNKAQSSSSILHDSNSAEEDDVSKKKKVHRKEHLVSDEKMSRHHTSGDKSAKKKKHTPTIDEDLKEKIYVRMTKRQMYSFIDGQEKQHQNPEFFDAPKNPNTSTQKSSTMDRNEWNSDIIDHDNDNEEVYVLMTKGQMYTFVDKQAERQVSDPKMIHNKRNDSNRQLYTMLFLLIAVLYPFWYLLAQMI